MREADPSNEDAKAGTTSFKALVQEYERKLILAALVEQGGHQRRTAARLGLRPTTLHAKMKRLGITSHAAIEPSNHGQSGR